MFSNSEMREHVPLQPYMLAWLLWQVSSHLQYTDADWAPAPAITQLSPATHAKALAATPITSTDCRCCLLVTQMYALEVYMRICRILAAISSHTSQKSCPPLHATVARQNMHAWMADMPREKQLWSELPAGWCPYMDGLQALALLLKLVLLLFQLAVAHAAAPVEADAYCLQPLAQDQRLERAP